MLRIPINDGEAVLVITDWLYVAGQKDNDGGRLGESVEVFAAEIEGPGDVDDLVEEFEGAIMFAARDHEAETNNEESFIS